ncbi:ATP-binding cassette domain-containing protein [Streptomyces sp. 8K308]|uniref:ABC transporter ATP-binding protein n=1 Tax=Streptomyces sp. 8K308 TaxID=2530388 RepID=UPI0010467280|nr:ATP-binding cassette domain-containing protein [Streptomyces sp. 8K308]TDC12605.1 ATP-binding cassette domain-containing protein [Streptomyces sp. 8K308]
MRLTGVSRRYGRRAPWVLRGVDLELGPGTLTRVEGGNGSGKSTLLRLVAGLDAPSRGRITGRPRRVGYVPERFPAALPLTARGYLTHLGRVHGLPGRRAAAEGERWLGLLGAAEHADTPMSELSKGSCQKVAVAQALLAAPELLVLDEAWTGLDQPARRTLDAAVEDRLAAGTTVLFVDHDPARLAHVPGAALRVEAGRLTAPGGPAATVVVEAVGPPDAPSPPGAERLPDGAVRLSVPATQSDALLRTLLAAEPAWHIRTVNTRP